MIIWDDVNGWHNIKLGGITVAQLKASHVQAVGTTSQVETAIKTTIDSAVSGESLHCYIHIFSKDPVDYSLWLGPDTLEPRSSWWEPLL
jgi:hypothetical protein